MRRPFLFPRFFSLWLILSLALPNPAFALRTLNAGQEESRVDDELRGRLQERPTVSTAGAEEPNPPSLAPGFGTGEFRVNQIGGWVPYTVQPGDRILQENVRYETPQGKRLASNQVRVGTKIRVRKIQTVNIPLNALGRFALFDLTFQIVPGAKRFLLQVWLDGKWEDLDLVHLGDGVPVLIGRERLPKEPDRVTQFDLEGKVGRPVSDDRYRKVFEGLVGDLKEVRVAVSWTENERRKTAYLPRQALSNYISGGDVRTQNRPGWNVSNGQFVPAYLAAGHLYFDIMGNEIVVSDLGSSNFTRIEVSREWAERQGYQVQPDGVSVMGSLRQKVLDSMESIRSQASAGNPAEDQSVIEGAILGLLQRMQNQMIVIDHLKNEVLVNPDKLVLFPFEEPFKIFFRINGKPQIATEFLVRDGQLHARAPSSEWKPVGNNYLAQEWVPVAGQDQFEANASRVREGYRVMYSLSTNTVVVLNHSPYQIRIAPAAGAEENLLVSEVVDLVMKDVRNGQVTAVQGSGVDLIGVDLTEEKVEALARQLQIGGWLQLRIKAGTAKLSPPVPVTAAGAEEKKGLAVQRYEGLFLNGDSAELEPDPAVAVQLNVEEGRRETWQVDVPSADLERVGRIFRRDGAELPAALGDEVRVIDFSARLLEAEGVFIQQQAGAGDLAFVAPGADNLEGLDDLLRAYQMKGIRLTPKALGELAEMDRARRAAALRALSSVPVTGLVAMVGVRVEQEANDFKVYWYV